LGSTNLCVIFYGFSVGWISLSRQSLKVLSNGAPGKTFRAEVCLILAVLVFIHTTPLYAQDGRSGFPPDSPGAG
jgi:hypothetical protein